MSNSLHLKNTAKVLLSLVVVACISYFFYRAFARNWATIQAQKLAFDYGFLSVAVLCIFATYLIPTYGWMLMINSLWKGRQLTVTQSVAVVNASNLTKYLPGKIWSFALQMYWLASAGFPKSLVVYVNAINLFISVMASLMFGLALLLPSAERFPLGITLSSLVVLVVIDILSLKFHDAVFKRLITLYNRVFKRTLQYFETSTRLLLQLHLLHLLAAGAFGLAAYFVCLGIGYHIQTRQIPLFMAALLLSDLIAFATIIVPGGLGVREGLMYAMLGGATSGPIALILPVATRAVHMTADVLLGGVAFKLLRSLNGPKKE